LVVIGGLGSKIRIFSLEHEKQVGKFQPHT